MLARASWTCVSISVDAEVDCSDTINGVKDWITACDTALAMPWTMVEFGVAMHVDVEIDGLVAVDVDMDIEFEAEGPARTRLTRGGRGPELRVTFLERDGRGIILWEKL